VTGRAGTDELTAEGVNVRAIGWIDESTDSAGSGVHAVRGRRLGLAVVTCALAIGTGATPALATTNNFIGGTNSNSWNTAANWSQGHVPLSTEDVTVTTADPTLSSALGGSDGVANSISISSGRTLTINARNLTVGTGTSSLAGQADISSGTLTLNGDTTWSAGAGTISMDTSSTMTINSTFEITADDSTNTDAGSLIHVSSTGSVTTSNAGTANINVRFDNDGSVSLGSGTLELGVGDNGTTAGSCTIAGGATLLLQAGSLQSASSSAPMSISGSGTAAVIAGTLTVGSKDTFAPDTVNLRGDGARLTVDKDVSIPTFTTTGSGNRVARDGSGTVTVTGSASFGAQTTFSGGTTTIADTVPSLSLGGAPLTIDSSLASATLTLNTPTTWSGTNNLALFGQTATLNIDSSFAITGDGQIGGAFSPLVHVAGTGSITTSNTGTVKISGLLDDDGAVTVGSGTLELAGGDNATTAGSYSVAGGATLQLDSGSLQSASPVAPMSISGSGTTAVAGGTLLVGTGDTFTPHTVDLRGNGARFTVDKDVSIPTFTTTGSANPVSRDGSGTLTVTGSASFGANTTFSGGVTTIADTVPSLSLGAGPLTVDTSQTSATLTLDTRTTWSGANNITLFGGATPATLNIDSSFAITGDGQIGAAFSTLIHIGGAGSITTSNAGAATIGAPLDNDGTIMVGSGTLQVDGGLTQAAGLTNVALGATIRGAVTLNGGTLKGNGTIDGSLANSNGTVAPGSSPGTLTVTGAYTQAPGGRLAEEITGTTPGAQFDQLLVAGTLTLDGTLAIDSTSFTPSSTDTFKIISGASSRTGTFAALTGSTVNGTTYSARYDTDGVTLLVSASAPPPNQTLSITFAGTGAGSVSDGASLNCASGCRHQYPQGTVLTLTATAAAGSTFVGWSGGGCSGTGSCQIEMNTAQGVTATFNTALPPTDTLMVTTMGTGSGRVISSPGGISCPMTCSSVYNHGTTVILSARAAEGSTFTGWSGACSGTGSCTLSMTQDLSATATFGLLPVVVTPPVVSGADLFCGVRHRGRCNGLKLKTTFFGPGNAVWQFAAYNSAPAHVAAAATVKVIILGTIKRRITKAGTVMLVFRLPAGARTNKLYNQIVELGLKSIRVTLTFTDAAGRNHVTTRRIRLKL
jgi:hypothetical protein